MNERQRIKRCNHVGELLVWSIVSGIFLSLIIAGWF